MELIQPKIKILKSLSNLHLTPWELVAQRNLYPWVKSQKLTVCINVPEDKRQQLRSIKNIYNIHIVLNISLLQKGRADNRKSFGCRTSFCLQLGIWAITYLSYAGGTDSLFALRLCDTLRSSLMGDLQDHLNFELRLNRCQYLREGKGLKILVNGSQRICLLLGLNRNMKEDFCLEQAWILAWILHWSRRLSQRSSIQPLPKPHVLLLQQKCGLWHHIINTGCAAQTRHLLNFTGS